MLPQNTGIQLTRCSTVSQKNRIFSHTAVKSHSILFSKKQILKTNDINEGTRSVTSQVNNSQSILISTLRVYYVCDVNLNTLAIFTSLKKFTAVFLNRFLDTPRQVILWDIMVLLLNIQRWGGNFKTIT